MALAPGTGARDPVRAKNSGRYLAEGEGLRSDRATLAKRAVGSALLRPLAPGNPVTSGKPAAPILPVSHGGGGLDVGGLLHHIGAFVQGRENIYGRPASDQSPYVDPRTGAPARVNAGLVVNPGVAMPVLKLAAAGLIGKQVGKAVPGVPGRVLRQASESAVGAPAGLYDLATKPGPTVKAIGRRYAHDYGPLLHGHPGEFLHRATMDPLGVGLDFAGAASLLTHAATRAGVVAKPAAERSLTVPGTEGTVQPFRSPNDLTAFGQHAFDRFSERHPDLPAVGAVPRAARRIGFEAERDFERAGAAAIPFMLAERQLRDPRLKVAYDVLHRYGHEEPGKAAELLKSEIEMRQARLDHPETPLIEKANQKKTLILLKRAQPLVDRYAADHGSEQAARSTVKLRAALVEGVPLANLGEQTRIELGQVHPDSAAARKEQPARLVTGGKFVEARLSRTLEQARSDVGRLEGQYAKASQAREQEAQKLLQRETARHVRTQGPPPHTLETAQARLAELQRQHEKFMQSVESRVTHEKVTPEQASKLLAEHDQQIAAQQAEVERIRSGSVDPENLKAFQARQVAQETGADVPVHLRPYARNEPGGMAERASRASDEETTRMVKSGEKPAAALRIQPLDEAKQTARELQQQGLHVRIHRFRDEGGPLEANVLVGRDAAAVERLHRAWRRPEGRSKDLEVGKALGYSEQDVRNYVERAHGPYRSSIEHRSDKRIVAEQQAHLRVAEQRLARLQRERGRFERAHKTGVLRHPMDKVETGRRNLARRALGHVPTLKEELRAHAEQEVERLVARNPEHASVKRYLETVNEIEHLKKTISDLQLKKLDAPLTRADLAQLGRAPSGGHNGDSAPAPARVGAGTILSGRKVLHARHDARVNRLGGALSVAKDRVQQLEEHHVKRYGFLPEQRHQIEIVGGQAPGKGAAYIGDTAPARIRHAVARARSVTGKGRKPDYQHQSRGVLFSEGRAKRTSKQVLRDFVSTARSLSRKRDVEEAAKFSKPLNQGSPTLLDHGHVFFNPEGHKIPRRFQEGPPAEELEQMLPAELARSARDEYDAYLKQVFVTPEAAAGLLDGKSRFAQAVKDGKIRQIDRRIADAFEKGATHVPSGATGISGHLLDLLDLANNVTRMGVLYGKGSFVPLNFGGNVGFLAIQQGPWLGVNLAKAAGVLGDLSRENLRWVDLEVGSGAALAITHEAVGPLGKATRAIGHVSNVAADMLPRRAAWIHEAAQRGVKTDADVARLRAQVEAGNPRAKAKANQISETAEKAMVQFRGLGPVERSVLTRTIFIYPWLKGATKYLGRLPLDRPLQATLAAHLGQQGYDDTVKTLGKLVSFLQGIVPTGKLEHRLGTDVIPVRNPAALTPFGTGAQTIQLFTGLLSGRSVPAAFRLSSLLQPSLGALLAASTHTNLTTGNAYPGDKGFGEILMSNLADSFAVQQTLKIAGAKPQAQPFTGSAANQRLYVEEGGFKAALKQFFEGGFRSRYLNVPAEQAKARAEQRESMTKLERARDDITTFDDDLLAAAGKAKLPIAHDGKLNPAVQLAVDALAARKLNRIAWAEKNGKKGTLTVADRLAADAELLVQEKKLTPQQAKRLATWAQRTSGTPLGQDQVQKILDTLGAVYFHRPVLSLVERALKIKGQDVRVPAP